MEQLTGNSENTTQNTQNSAKETHNEGSNLVNRLVDVEPIEGSPFTLVKDRSGYDEITGRGNKMFIAVGSHRVTEVYETEDEAMDQFIEQPWNMTVTLITIVLEKLLELKEINKRIKENGDMILAPNFETKDKLDDHMKPGWDVKLTEEEKQREQII